MSVSIRQFTRRTPPRHAYEKIAQAALPGWDISLVFVGETRAKQLNQSLRKKSYVPNVLSYETSSSPRDRSGEIIICLTVAERQAPDYDLSYAKYVAYLFIHGLAHLKGYPHGTTMERYEGTLMSRFIR